MRRVTYKSVLDRIAGYLGEADGLDTEDKALAEAKVNLFVRLGWEFFFHPETLDVEKRTFRPLYSAATAYTAGTVTAGVPSTTSEVLFPGDGNYYQAVTSTTGNAPASSDGGGGWTVNFAFWALSAAAYNGPDWAAGVNQQLGDIVRNPNDGLFYSCFTAHTTVGTSIDLTKYGVLTPFVRSIAYNQVDGNGNPLTPLGLVKAVWDRDPTLGGMATVTTPAGVGWGSTRPLPQPFRLRSDFVQVLGLQNTVWVEFQNLVPVFSGTMRSDTATYDAGDEVYDTATGDYWIANQSVNAGESPTTTPAKWGRVEFPYYLAEFVAQSAYAQLVSKEQQQPENFSVLQAAGYPLLAAELDHVERMEGQTRQLNVVSGRR